MVDDRYTIISADGHAGGDFDAYRPHLASAWHSEFDAWVKTYVNPFADLLEPTAYRNWDNERRLAETESDGIVAEVLFPNTVPPFFDESGLVALPPTEADYDRRWAGLQAHNRWMAEFCAAAPGRLMFWAHAPLNVPGAAAEELRRACTELGAKGLVAGGANFGGLEFDSPELDPVWQVLSDLDLPMFIHGYNQSVTWGEKANDDRYETTAIVGMQYDETRCFWNLVCGGVLDRFPNLKVYITHGGGYVPYQLGRLAQTNKNLDVVHNKRPVLDYLKNFWFDVELHEVPMRQALIDTIGADHVVYGSNFGGSDAVRHDLTDGLKLSDADAAIPWLNAPEDSWL